MAGSMQRQKVYAQVTELCLLAKRPQADSIPPESSAKRPPIDPRFTRPVRCTWAVSAVEVVCHHRAPTLMCVIGWRGGVWCRARRRAGRRLRGVRSSRPWWARAGQTVGGTVPGVIRPQREARMGAMPDTMQPAPFPSVYQLRVVVRGVSPLIWRRLLVPADTTIAGLHAVLQVAFGWTGTHLHRFVVQGREYGIG